MSGQEITTIEPPPVLAANGDFFKMVEKLASMKVDVESLKAILDMNKEVMAKNAEMEFNQAMTRLQAKLPMIDRKGKIQFKDKNNVERNTPFARYEDIDEAIRPFLLEEGFSISFDTQWGNDGAVIFGTLSHVAGHSRTSSMRLPLDASGSKNNLQAMGSTISYGKRYLVGMLLNIITKGIDDDGDKGGTKRLDDKQINTIEEWLHETKSDKAAFLKVMGANFVEDIKASQYDEAIKMFEKKKKQVVK